eukprot:15476133-Alexandrium_andersonii.AAC.1
MHCSIPARVETYVDDMVPRNEGTARMLEVDSFHKVLGLCRAIVGHGLRISPKSLLLSTSSGLTKSIQARLAAEGFHREIAEGFKDLGVDNFGGRR